ncbi:MAG: tetratricopeptide repeat protein [Pseudomonadota bacterium]
MQPGAIARRLAAILCADVQGYSRLMGGDEEGTLRALKASHEVMARLIGESRGRVVNAPGDSVLAEFGSIVDAVSCAVAIQAELARRNRDVPPERRMAFRIGINLGDVMVDGESIYGDGVNVAARLESLAEGDGICISGSAYEQVAGKLKFGFQDLGEKAVKNIERPVHVYRVLPEGAAATGARAAPRGGAKAAADKPSIAVLPFQNMSGEPEQEYFSDGITEDIITDLCKLSGLLVIARNSTFTYKGKPVDVRQVGKEFGVSHVLEGSVRRAGGRVRITAQLLDSASAHHLWAERYDRDLSDIFALQDEITREIVAALDVKLVRGEQAALWRKSLKRPEALDAYYRGLDQLNRITREANVQAARCFEEVVRLEPDSPLGHLGAAWAHLSDFRYGWSDSGPASLERAAALARKALELEEGCADAHALLGYHHLLAGRHADAIAAGERSVALSPNHADNSANLGCSYAVSGKPAEAVAAMKRAMRLSPVYPAWYLNILGFAHYVLGEFDQAESAVRLALEREPGYAECRLILAAAHHGRGRVEEARHEAQEVLRRDPAFRLSGFAARLAIVKDRALVARLLDLFRELGLQ